MRCPYCGTEVTPGMERCPRCEVAIVWNEREAEFLAPGDFVEVYRAGDPMSLPVVESLLESNDIPYFVANGVTQDFLSWGRVVTGYNVLLGPPIVKVPESRADEARELIAAMSQPPPPGVATEEF